MRSASVGAGGNGSDGAVGGEAGLEVGVAFGAGAGDVTGTSAFVITVVEATITSFFAARSSNIRR